MMFYNGFNLLIDVLLGLTVWFITYRLAWWDGYEAGVVDEITAQDMYDNKCNHVYESHCPKCGIEGENNG